MPMPERTYTQDQLEMMTSGRVRRFGLMNRLDGLIGSAEALSVVTALPDRNGTLCAARVSSMLLESGLRPEVVDIVSQVHERTMD